MKNNDCTQIVTLSEGFIKYLKEKRATDDLRELIELKDISCDEQVDYDEELDDLEYDLDGCDCEKIIDTVVRLCESGGKATPRKTVKKIEKLLLESDYLLLSPCFLNRYIQCLACSCSSDEADEGYIQTVVNKLKLFIEESDSGDGGFIINPYIASLSKLSTKQEPAHAETTIRELKAFGDEMDAWEDSENLFQYCVALEHLCCKQSKIDAAKYKCISDGCKKILKFGHGWTYGEKTVRLKKDDDCNMERPPGSVLALADIIVKYKNSDCKEPAELDELLQVLSES